MFLIEAYHRSDDLRGWHQVDRPHLRLARRYGLQRADRHDLRQVDLRFARSAGHYHRQPVGYRHCPRSVGRRRLRPVHRHHRHRVRRHHLHWARHLRPRPLVTVIVRFRLIIDHRANNVPEYASSQRNPIRLVPVRRRHHQVNSVQEYASSQRNPTRCSGSSSPPSGKQCAGICSSQRNPIRLVPVRRRHHQVNSVQYASSQRNPTAWFRFIAFFFRFVASFFRIIVIVSKIGINGKSGIKIGVVGSVSGGSSGIKRIS